MDPQRFFCWRDGWNLHPLMVHPRTVEPATYWTEEPSRPSQILKMSTSPQRYKPVWQFPDAGAALIAPLDSFERERLRADWGGSGGMYHDGREISHSLTMFNSAFQVRFVNLLHPPKIAINLGAIPGNWNYGNLTDQLYLGACLKVYRKIQWFKKLVSVVMKKTTSGIIHHFHTHPAVPCGTNNTALEDFPLPRLMTRGRVTPIFIPI